MSIEKMVFNGHFWSHRLAVRTLASHAGNTGSNPVGTMKYPPEPACLCLFALRLITFRSIDLQNISDPL